MSSLRVKKMKANDLVHFDHNPLERGFKPLAKAFADYVSGQIGYHDFMIKWHKAPPKARVEFKKFLETFDKVTAPIFKALAD